MSSVVLPLSPLRPHHDHPSTTARHDIAATWNPKAATLDQLAQGLGHQLSVAVADRGCASLGLALEPLREGLLADLVAYGLPQRVQLA